VEGASRVLLVVVALGASSCGSWGVERAPHGETDNPLPFQVIALADGRDRYARSDASLTCSSKVYCEATPPGPDCYCERYRLRTPDFSFEWSAEAPSGGRLTSDVGSVIVRDRAGSAASGELTITQTGRTYSAGSFYRDFAGTFIVVTPEHSFTRGVFFAHGP
jgi:hypothetical protein